MSYTGKELSIQSGNPVFLYLFTQEIGWNTGDYQYWRFFSGPGDYEWDEQTWIGSNVAHSDITQSPEIAKDGITLTFPRRQDVASEFAQQFLGGYSPTNITTLTIWRGHLDDGEFIAYWKGRVVGAKSAGQRIEMECESVFTEQRIYGVRMRAQRTCPYALYGYGCGLNYADFAETAQITDINGTQVIFKLLPKGGWGLSWGFSWGGLAIETRENGWFAGGMILTENNTLEYLLTHENDEVGLFRPIKELAVGDIVQLFPGCDLTFPTCRDKFGNAINFGGLPWMPERNAFEGSAF